MTTAETLKAAREKIADPAHWIQEAYARTDKGREIGCNTPGACAWCATGAIAAVQGFSSPVWDNGLYDAFDHFTDSNIEMINDSSTHEQVLALFDNAIARAEAQA